MQKLKTFSGFNRVAACSRGGSGGSGGGGGGGGGGAASAGSVDRTARRGAFDSSTSRYPQYPAEPRTGKCFVCRVGTFEAPSYAVTACTSHAVLSFPPASPPVLPSPCYGSCYGSGGFSFRRKGCGRRASSAKPTLFPAPLRLAWPRAREKTARSFERALLLPRGCHARPAFLPACILASFLPSCLPASLPSLLALSSASKSEFRVFCDCVL